MLPPYYYVGQDPRAAATIAILGLEVVGAIDLASLRIARELTAALRSRAANGPYAIAPNSDKELLDQKVMHNCPDDRKECLTKIGRALNANYLLYGRIDRRSQRAAPVVGYQISLWLLTINSGHLASWTDFIPVAEASGTKLAERAHKGYARLVADLSGEKLTERRREAYAPPHRPVTDRVLTNTTNATFWAITKYKPGQHLDMHDPKDREMSKIWLQIYEDIKRRRQRATDLAQRALNETVTPYVLVIERRDGSLVHQEFPHRYNLDTQYSWLLDQPDRYTYIAAFDFTKNRGAPLYDQFALMRRSQIAGSWYGWPESTGIAGWG